jgi:hypothetical protein
MLSWYGLSEHSFDKIDERDTYMLDGSLWRCSGDIFGRDSRASCVQVDCSENRLLAVGMDDLVPEVQNNDLDLQTKC